MWNYAHCACSMYSYNYLLFFSTQLYVFSKHLLVETWPTGTVRGVAIFLPSYLTYTCVLVLTVCLIIIVIAFCLLVVMTHLLLPVLCHAFPSGHLQPPTQRRVSDRQNRATACTTDTITSRSATYWWQPKRLPYIFETQPSTLKCKNFKFWKQEPFF